jgi:hypothetical protein
LKIPQKKKKEKKKNLLPFSFFLIFFFVSPFNRKKIYTTREKYNRLGPNNTPVDFEMRRNNARGRAVRVYDTPRGASATSQIE